MVWYWYRCECMAHYWIEACRLNHTMMDPMWYQSPSQHPMITLCTLCEWKEKFVTYESSSYKSMEQSQKRCDNNIPSSLWESGKVTIYSSSIEKLTLGEIVTQSIMIQLKECHLKWNTFCTFDLVEDLIKFFVDIGLFRFLYNNCTMGKGNKMHDFLLKLVKNGIFL